MEKTSERPASTRRNTNPLAGLTPDQVERAYHHADRKERGADRLQAGGLAVGMVVCGCSVFIAFVQPFAAATALAWLLLALAVVAFLIAFAAKSSRWHVVVDTLAFEYPQDVRYLRSLDRAVRERSEREAHRAEAAYKLMRSGVLDEDEK